MEVYHKSVSCVVMSGGCSCTNPVQSGLPQCNKYHLLLFNELCVMMMCFSSALQVHSRTCDFPPKPGCYLFILFLNFKYMFYVSAVDVGPCAHPLCVSNLN